MEIMEKSTNFFTQLWPWLLSCCGTASTTPTWAPTATRPSCSSRTESPTSESSLFFRLAYNKLSYVQFHLMCCIIFLKKLRLNILARSMTNLWGRWIILEMFLWLWCQFHQPFTSRNFLQIYKRVSRIFYLLTTWVCNFYGKRLTEKSLSVKLITDVVSQCSLNCSFNCQQTLNIICNHWKVEKVQPKN